MSAWFGGRINRREFFVRLTVGCLLLLLAFLPIFLRICRIGCPVSRSVPEVLIVIPLVVIAFMLCLGYMLPATVRRLHDLGASGWWVVVAIVLQKAFGIALGNVGVLIGKSAWCLFLLSWPGTEGPNEYGEEPRFEVRKLMGRRFATILAVMFVVEAALCGWTMVVRRALEIPIPQAEVDGMLANLAKANDVEGYGRFNQRMDGQRLTMTNLTVLSVYGKGRGWKEVACQTGEGANVLLYVPSRVMDTLPRDLVDNDPISRVQGHALASLDSLNRFDSVRPRQGNAILLEAERIDVPWQDEQLPTIDPSVSGDGLLRITADLQGDARERERKCARLCRTLVGRTLEFSECRVDDFRLDAKIPCVTLETLNPDGNRDGLRFSVPIGGGRVGPDDLLGLHVGQRLRSVRTVVCDKDDEGEELEDLTAGVWMRLLEFAADEPTVALPPFDGARITGDELVALLRAHKNRLSPIQIDELQRKLSGRRLTFTGMGLRSCGGADGEINNADFAFSDIALQLKAELEPVTQKKFDSQPHKTLTGTVAEKPANDSYGDRALRLVGGEIE